MKRHFLYIGILLLGMQSVVTSCTQDIDESDLYTATGQTIEQYISNDSTLTSFNYILQRSGYDRMMDAWGTYTCLAPTNEGVAFYVDSLYNDPDATIEHNGMTENSLEGLTDSLCNDIAQFHLCNEAHSVIDLGLGSGTTISTILGRSISVAPDDSTGVVTFNGTAYMTEGDIEVTNGVLHKISRIIPKSNRLLADVLQRRADYSIFSEALQRTGLADSITAIRKNHKNSNGEWGYDDLKGLDILDTDGSTKYWAPTTCNVAYTIFAESDDVMRRNGINSFDDLVKYANQVYGGAASWYDYLGETGHTVSTGDDYTNRFNALNMFVAYHILYAGMAQDQMVFEKKAGIPVTENASKWNYVNGGEPYDYYETMLPHTLLKIWEPDQGKTLYINRWKRNNTLTDQVPTEDNGYNGYGSDAMHPIEQQGVRITREDIQALNGYIHPIQGMLVYDANVPHGVLNERLRFDSMTFLPEFENNGFRYMSTDEVAALNGGNSGARIAFPRDYFDNVKVFTDGTQLRYNVKGNYNHYQANAFQGWGNYDLAVRIPSVPSGLYEFRICFQPMDHGGMMQYYYGTEPEVQSMIALGIPHDSRIASTDPRIGWTAFYEEDDYGIATDDAMRKRGYMRAPYSFRSHPGESGDETKGANSRGSDQVRIILGRLNLKQSDEFWLRIKNLQNDDLVLKWQLDFVELVPVTLVDNDQYSEDWY